MKYNKLVQTVSLGLIVLVFLSCKSTPATETQEARITPVSYPYKATYSSEVVNSTHLEYLQSVLTVWKSFETKQFDAMKQYYADTVTYEDASGFRFYGKSDSLLAFARRDVEALDSLRFDISMWQNIHLTDKNEDWVYIWSVERRYPKTGHPDTSLIHEQWKIVNGKVAYFNQYKAKPSMR